MKRVVLFAAMFVLAIAAPRGRRRSVTGRGRDRRPAVPGARQRRLRRPALRPRPALRDERAVAGDRRHGDDPRARDPVALALRPRLRRPSSAAGRRQRRAGDVHARRRGAGDHAAAGAAQGRAVRRHRSRTSSRVPTVPNPDDSSSTAFFITPDGSATAPPARSGAHCFLPSNDHPRDKASVRLPLRRPGRHDRASPTACRSAQVDRPAGARTSSTSSASRWPPS